MREWNEQLTSSARTSLFQYVKSPRIVTTRLSISTAPVHVLEHESVVKCHGADVLDSGVQ